MNNWFRPKHLRNFSVGDRVEWDGRDLGTVVAILDEDALAVEWDDPELGRAMAPAWSMRLMHALDAEYEVTEPCCIWDEPTCPGDYA